MSGWPTNLANDDLPGELYRDLAEVKPGTFKAHDAVEQAMFRSVEELVTNFRESLDLRGERFGKLSVVGYSHLVPHTDKNSNEVTHFDQWIVQCDCGSETKTVGGNHLRTGNTRSCGCARGRYGKRTENYHNAFPSRFQNWKHPQRFQVA